MSRAHDWRTAARAMEQLALVAEDRALRAISTAQRTHHYAEADRLRERAAKLRRDAAREELRAIGGWR